MESLTGTQVVENYGNQIIEQQLIPPVTSQAANCISDELFDVKRQEACVKRFRFDPFNDDFGDRVRVQIRKRVSAGTGGPDALVHGM